jgi:hypothetical protein
MLTVAIVNTAPLQSYYPKENSDLAERIIQSGCIIHPFETRALEQKESGMYLNQFQRRLLERDILLAKVTPKIVAVCDAEVISGGTRYAVSYGKSFGQEVIRLTSSGEEVENPRTKSCKISWETEIKELL